MKYTISPELSEICGIHAGDGYLRYKNKHKEFDLSGHIDEKQYYDNHVIPLFNRTFNLKLKGRYYLPRNTYGFRTSSGELIKNLIEFGFPSGKKSSIVEIPKQVVNSNYSKIWCAFLRGYCDTDGCFTFDRKVKNKSRFQQKFNYYPRIMFTTCSKPLAKGIQVLSERISLKCKLYNCTPKKETESLKYKLQITGINAINKWMSLIGSSNHYKYSRYLIWKRFGHCPPNTNYQNRKDILSGKFDPKSAYEPVV